MCVAAKRECYIYLNFLNSSEFWMLSLQRQKAKQIPRFMNGI